MGRERMTDEDLRLLRRGMNSAYDQILNHDELRRGAMAAMASDPGDSKAYLELIETVRLDIRAIRTEWEMRGVERWNS